MKYKVTWIEPVRWTCIVEADNEDEATDKALNGGVSDEDLTSEAICTEHDTEMNLEVTVVG